MRSSLAPHIGPDAGDPAEVRARAARCWHERLVALIPLDVPLAPEERQVVERICDRLYGRRPLPGRRR